METTNTNPEDQVQDSTTVGQVDVNIDEIFGMPGADSVMLPAEEEKPKSMFHKETVDTSFFDNPTASPEERQQEQEKKVEVQETINELDNLIAQENKNKFDVKPPKENK